MENVTKLTEVPINDVYQITLRNSNGLKVEILNYGGIIRSIYTPNRNGVSENVLLGYSNLADYFHQDNFPFGSMQCLSPSLTGIQVTKNHDKQGKGYNRITNTWLTREFERSLWTIASVDESTLELSRHIHFHGGIEQVVSQIIIIYRITPDNTLHIEYIVVSNIEVPLKINHLCYFNLSACKEALDSHNLQVGAGRFIQSDTKKTLFTDSGITDEGHPVIKRIGKQPLNHYWLADEKKQSSRTVASLIDMASGRKLEVLSAQNIFHISSKMYANRSKNGKNGLHYDDWSGVLFVPRSFATRLGEEAFRRLSDHPVYHQEIKYKFSVI